MNGLYGHSCPACGGLHATNADMAVRFNKDALAEAQIKDENGTILLLSLIHI